MRIIRYEADGRSCWGVIDEARGDSVTEISGSPFGPYQTTSPGPARGGPASRPLASVRILAPCLPSKIFALAHNYADHLHGKPAPKEPQIFLKVPSSVIGTGDAIVLPREQGRIDEEAELVVVMGKKCRGVPASEALSCVLGYTCGNDVSARAWQKNDLNWWRAKSTDTFSPIGPMIVTDVDPRAARITGRINGREVQRCNSSDLIFEVPSLIEWISRWVTLEPGDLIFTGTSGEPAELHPGDTVEVSIEGIGELRNTVA